MFRRIAITVAALATTAVLVAPTGASASYCSFKDIMASKVAPTTAAQAESAERVVMCLVNGARSNAGLPDLTYNPKLAQAARNHSKDMVARRYFAHASPEGKKADYRMQQAGYLLTGTWAWAENIFCGSGSLSSANAAMNWWMNSPGHKANILSPKVKEIGVGVALGSPKTSCDGSSSATYTQVFGAHS